MDDLLLDWYFAGKYVNWRTDITPTMRAFVLEEARRLAVAVLAKGSGSPDFSNSPNA